MQPHEESDNFDADDATASVPFDSEGGDAAAGDAAGETEATASLRRDRDALEEKLLHSMADYQNLARRARLDVQQASEHKAREIGRGLLTVLDHFDRALNIDVQQTSTQDLLQGMSIVHDELIKALASFGIGRMAVEPGDVFDPNRHEALMRMQVEGMNPGHIAQVLQPGYVHHEMTIRPAKVAVSE